MKTTLDAATPELLLAMKSEQLKGLKRDWALVAGASDTGIGVDDFLFLLSRHTASIAVAARMPQSLLLAAMLVTFTCFYALGEGSYARVVYARLKPDSPYHNLYGGVNEFALKIMDKQHIEEQDKKRYVYMERDVLGRHVILAMQQFLLPKL